MKPFEDFIIVLLTHQEKEKIFQEAEKLKEPAFMFCRRKIFEENQEVSD